MVYRFMIKLIRFFFIIILSLIVLFCVLFAFVQSKWAKEQIKEKIISYLKESGISVKINDLNGRLPFSWTIKETDLHFNNDDQLKLQDVKVRIAIVPLLKGRFAINYFTAENAEYFCSPLSPRHVSFSLTDNKIWLQRKIKSIKMPCGIEIRHLKIARIKIIDCGNGSDVSFGIMGKAKIYPDFEEFLVDLTLFSTDHKKTYLEAYFNGNKRTDFIETHIKFNLDSLSFLLARKFETKINAEFSLEGPWKTWKELLYDHPRTESPLCGEFRGFLSNVHFENADILDRDWKFKMQFSLLSGQRAYVQKLLLLSDLIHIKGKGILNSELEKSKAMVAFSLPNLSDLSSFSPLPIAGSAHGKALYQDETYKASFQTVDLQIDSVAIKTMCGLVKGSQEGNEWEGETRLSSTDAQLPFESAFAFEYFPGNLISVSDFNLKISDAVMQGYLSYDIPNHLYDASFHSHADHLDPFAIFLKDEDLGGSFTAECSLFPEEQKQNVKCSLVSKNLRFKNYFLEDFTFQAEIQDLFKIHAGQFHGSANKVYTPNFYLDHFDFSTQSDEVNWPFSINADGRIENPFHLSVQGFWQKESTLFTLELTNVTGDLAEIPFALQYPSGLEWGSHYLYLSPFDMRIGEGHFYSTFEFSPIRSLGHWNLSHFPLEILRCFQARFKWNGLISTNGFFDATSENIEGVLNTVLEETDILHFGKEQPFRAKGTFQAHLNHKILQIYTDLHATDKQFLDFTASLPIVYQLYPFCIAFDEAKNASAELIAEGKLQDLFDFVNLGTNHFTGLLSCRLYLFNTLASPALLGQLELQQGTYENYFTGIALRHIDAQFEAHGDTIRCLTLKGNDEKKGEITATGKILLKPKEHFPYAFEMELNNVHALGFDMIDCNLTGPLYLTGDTQNMLAQGNLLIDEAKIQITEHLPYEVPSLPLTYVNFSPSLYSRTIKQRRKFVFQIDLELSAEGKVLVEGRGLNAELEGNVHLYGKNTNIAANGALKLIKGEYQFSGKVFKLTEGEIVFNDKPAPSAYLNLNGTLSMPQVTITAMLRGPLRSPQLTFQSNPQKSTSSILALILFNKDITEISHPEAVQLANALVSLSGGAGPDVLESIRKSLGVDRLNISSKPGTDEIAIQIGKYLTRGVMITLSQSATSSQVIIEVELPKGFVFQAETQEEEEGKFSLKWTKSY